MEGQKTLRLNLKYKLKMNGGLTGLGGHEGVSH